MSRAMLALVKPFFNMCLLRVSPQQLPASDLLLLLSLGAYLVCGVLISTISLPAGTAILAGITDTALLCALTLSVLHTRQLRERVRQTLTALAGTGAVLSFFALPITGWLQAAHARGDPTAVPGLMLLLLIGWSLSVAGHILRHALSTAFFAGLILAVVFYGISISVLNFLFPIPL